MDGEKSWFGHAQVDKIHLRKNSSLIRPDHSMANPILGPRKRRTRQHVIADLSIHHVEGFILEEGHTVQRLGSDHGYDLILFTYDANGYPEPGLIYFQFKAMDRLDKSGTDY